MPQIEMNDQMLTVLTYLVSHHLQQTPKQTLTQIRDLSNNLDQDSLTIISNQIKQSINS